VAGLVPNLPNYSYYLPWFIWDLQKYQLITSTLPPGDIKDTKPITLVETPIPGLNYAPIQPSVNGNRKISFTIPLIKRNNTVGNTLVLKQFDRLRNQSTGFFKSSAQQFTPNPKVLYYWGTGSIPLEYYVSKVDFGHKQGWISPLGQPMYSEIEIELTLDEEAPIYAAEEMYRKVSAIAGEAVNAIDTAIAVLGGKAI